MCCSLDPLVGVAGAAVVQRPFLCAELNLREGEVQMRSRCVLILVLFCLYTTTARAGYWDTDQPGKLRDWCERPLKSASLNLHRDPVKKLTEDLRKQLERMKITGAKAQVALEVDKVTILVTHNFPRPKRATVGGMVMNGVVVHRTERVEYGWQVHVSARKGKLVTSSSRPISEDYSY